MKTKQIWLVLIGLGLNSCLVCSAQSPPSDPLSRQRQIDLERALGTDANWMIGASGLYTNGTDGKPVWNTNTDQFWRGIWKEDTNGWRVELNFSETNTPEVAVAVRIGSIVKNSDDGTGDYFTTPYSDFAKIELLTPDGVIVQPKWRGTLKGDFPQRISVGLYPRGIVGPLAGEFLFVSNGPPFYVGGYRLKDAYSITNEGDYTLTVCPVLYKNLTGKKIDVSDENFHISNTNLLDRVDLPSVSAKIHLMPSR
jgi:hypothetical protein